MRRDRSARRSASPVKGEMPHSGSSSLSASRGSVWGSRDLASSYRGYRAAVDMEIGSGEVARAIGDDKRHEFGDLVGPAGTVEGDAAELAYQLSAGGLLVAAGHRGHGVEHLLSAFCVDEAGQH